MWDNSIKQISFISQVSFNALKQIILVFTKYCLFQLFNRGNIDPEIEF